MRTFKIFFSIEENAELSRKRLAKRPYFNVHEAFAALDADRSGFITRDEIKQILKEY
jgi:Ca2+-binding EF-hand superfamily protein